MSQRLAPGSRTVVTIAREATAFSCVCERCLGRARDGAASFGELLGEANVRGTLAPEADSGLVRCWAGHELLIRRGSRQARLTGTGRPFDLARAVG